MEQEQAKKNSALNTTNLEVFMISDFEKQNNNERQKN